MKTLKAEIKIEEVNREDGKQAYLFESKDLATMFRSVTLSTRSGEFIFASHEMASDGETHKVVIVKSLLHS